MCDAKARGKEKEGRKLEKRRERHGRKEDEQSMVCSEPATSLYHSKCMKGMFVSTCPCLGGHTVRPVCHIMRRQGRHACSCLPACLSVPLNSPKLSHCSLSHTVSVGRKGREEVRLRKENRQECQWYKGA